MDVAPVRKRCLWSEVGRMRKVAKRRAPRHAAVLRAGAYSAHGDGRRRRLFRSFAVPSARLAALSAFLILRASLGLAAALSPLFCGRPSNHSLRREPVVFCFLRGGARVVGDQILTATHRPDSTHWRVCREKNPYLLLVGSGQAAGARRVPCGLSTSAGGRGRAR